MYKGTCISYVHISSGSGLIWKGWWRGRGGGGGGGEEGRGRRGGGGGGGGGDNMYIGGSCLPTNLICGSHR